MLDSEAAFDYDLRNLHNHLWVQITREWKQVVSPLSTVEKERRPGEKAHENPQRKQSIDVKVFYVQELFGSEQQVESTCWPHDETVQIFSNREPIRAGRGDDNEMKWTHKLMGRKVSGVYLAVLIRLEDWWAIESTSCLDLWMWMVRSGSLSPVDTMVKVLRRDMPNILPSAFIAAEPRLGGAGGSGTNDREDTPNSMPDSRADNAEALRIWEEDILFYISMYVATHTYTHIHTQWDHI